MITVVDQQRPWLRPSSTFATTTQVHVGAKMMSKGTGKTNEPARDEDALAADAVAHSTGEQVRERLDYAEADDE